MLKGMLVCFCLLGCATSGALIDVFDLSDDCAYSKCEDGKCECVARYAKGKEADYEETFGD